MKTKHFPLIPAMANDSLLEGNEGNMKEIGERTQGWENLKERARLSAILRAFQGKNYSRGIGDVWHPSKTKVGSCYNHKTNPEIGKKQETSDNQIFSFSHSFPLGPQPPN